MLFCFDIDGSLTDYPDEIGAIMRSLQANGHEVHVLSGHRGTTVTPEVMEVKTELLKSLGCSDAYSKLVVFASPKNKVASQKVAYMQRAGACALVDNDKKNSKAVAKAGFLALRVGKRPE